MLGMATNDGVRQCLRIVNIKELHLQAHYVKDKLGYEAI